MNSVHIMGRLTRDPEVRVAQTGMSVATFTVAVDRAMTKEISITLEKILYLCTEPKLRYNNRITWSKRGEKK